MSDLQLDNDTKEKETREGKGDYRTKKRPNVKIRALDDSV
jgi:hypothetical protein